MKKILFLSVFLFCMFLVPDFVNAAVVMPDPIDNTITLTEDVTLTSSFVVTSGENLTLDLREFTISNNGSIDTIVVEKDATLTIEGNGTITNNAVSKVVIANNGTVVINDGNFLATKNGTVDDCYIILNHGIMTIYDGFFKTSSEKSSLIDNGYYNFSSNNQRTGYVEGVNHLKPTLLINGGVFDGGINTVKNDDNGILTINNGLFRNTVQVSLQNWNEAVINGGIFETPTGNDKTNVFVGSYSKETVGKLVINDGIFNAIHAFEISKKYPTSNPIIVNGGTFNNTGTFANESDKFSLIPVGLLQIKGNVVASTDAVKYATDGVVVTLTNANSMGTFTVPTGVFVELNASDNYVIVDNGNGTSTIHEPCNRILLDDVVSKIDNLNESIYTSESVAIFNDKVNTLYEEIDSLNYILSEQSRIDEIVSELNDAFDGLIEIINPKNVTVAKTSYNYTGLALNPSVTVTDNFGKKLSLNTDYKIYYSNNIYPGTAKVIIKGIGKYSGEIEKTFKINAPVLPATTKVSVKLYGYNDIKATWNKVSGASGYFVYVKRSISSSWTKYARTTGLSFNIPNRYDGYKYYVRIVPYKLINGIRYEGTEKTSGYIYTLKKLNTPTVTKYSSNYVRVKWNNISGESGYQIARKAYGSKYYYIVKTVSYKYSSTTLKTTKGKTYYYKVRAYKIVDGKKIYGPWSYVKSYKLR